MRREPSGDALGTADPSGEQQERNTEPKRVGDEEHGAGPEVLVEEQSEDRPEIRPHAWRESDAERDADERASRKPAGLSLQAQVELAREERYADETEHLHTEHDEKEPAQPLQPVDHLPGECPDERDHDP